MRKLVFIAIAISILSGINGVADAKSGKHKEHKEQQISNNKLIMQDMPRHTQPVIQQDEKEPWLKIKLSISEKGTLLRCADEIVALPHPAQQQNLPPGLAKKVARGKRLPPGWQRKLAIGKTFPQSVYDHATPLPPYILHQLPKQPDGTMLVVVQGKIVRLLEATKTIADIFDLKW